MYLNKFITKSGSFNHQKYRFDIEAQNYVHKHLEERGIDFHKRKNSECFYLVYHHCSPYRCNCGNETGFEGFIQGYRKHCSYTCRSNDSEVRAKVKATNLKRLGVENPFLSPEIQNAILQRNGGYNAAQLPEVREKISVALNQIYSDEKRKQAIISKRHNTIIETYGSLTSFTEKRTQQIKDKHGSDAFNKWSQNAKLKFKEKYGYNQPFEMPELQNKAKDSLIKLYGVDNASKIPGVTDKRIETNKQRYNRDWFNQSHISDINLEIIQNKHLFIDFCAELDYNCFYIMRELNIGYSKLCNVAAEYQIYDKLKTKNLLEQKIYDYLTTLLPDTEIIVHTRKVIPPQEIDIYVPDFNIGIEVNGLYWHSERHGVQRSYHSKKSNDAHLAGVRLIHLFEDDIIYKWDIVKSKLAVLFGQASVSIGARQCQLLALNHQQSYDFFTDNHLFGNSVFSKGWGLWYNDRIIFAMTFSKNRFKSDNNWEIVRIASEKDTIVPGGVSRIITQFKRDINAPLMTFIDKTWVPHYSYISIPEFKYVDETSPGYHYLVKGKRESRQKYQKHKLSKLLSKYDSSLSERENMANNGFYRIWNCGSLKYVIS